MFTDQYLLPFPSPSFTSIFLFFLSILFSSHGVRTLALVFGYTLRNDVSVDMRSELCSNQWIVEIGGSVLLASDLAFLTL